MVTKNLKEKLLAEAYDYDTTVWKSLDKKNQRKITLLESKLQAIKVLVEKELNKVRHGSERKILTTILDKINGK